MSGGAVLMRQQNMYLRRFSQAGATSEARAKTLEEVGCRDSLIRRQLVRRGVLVEVSPDRYYLDEGAAAAFVARRRLIVLTAVLIALLVMTFVLVRSASG